MVNFDFFQLKKTPRNGILIYASSLTNQCTSEFLKVNTLKSIFPGVNIIKSVHSLNETKPVIARPITTATGGKSVLQTEKKIANESFKKPLSNFHLLKT